MSSRLPPLPIPGILADPPEDADEDGVADGRAATRLARRRGQRLQMLGMAAASYAVDTLLLLALAAAGALPSLVAVSYGVAAAACCAGFAVLLGSGWSERCRDHYLAVPQMLAHASLLLTFVAWAPQVGGLMMMLLFIVFGFGSLRMGRRDVTRGAMAIAVMIGALVSTVGDSLAVPLDGPAQRLLSGLWISLILMRTAMLGLYGAQLRELLARRNEELAATFAKLEHLASRDGLTGVLNRRSLMQAIQVELERLRRGGEGFGFGVVLFDLDHFKQVNDGHGHVVGDEVLRRFAQEAGRVLRTSDHLGC